MGKSIKLKNDTYLDSSSITHHKKKLTDIINGDNTFMIITGDRTISNTKYTGKLGMGADKSIALEISNDGTVLGRIAVMSDGTIKNYVSGKQLLESGYIQVSADDFFSNTNYTISECLIYKCGNLLNIQRLVISDITKTTSPTTIATINSAYRPCGNTTLKFAGTDANSIINTILYINSNGQLRYQATTNDGSKYRVYALNVTYVIE